METSLVETVDDLGEKFTDSMENRANNILNKGDNMANTNNVKDAVGNLGKELNSSMKNWATNKSESLHNWGTENKKEIRIALISAGIGFAIKSLITKKRPEIIISTLNVDTEDPYTIGMRYNQANKEDK